MRLAYATIHFSKVTKKGVSAEPPDLMAVQSIHTVIRLAFNDRPKQSLHCNDVLKRALALL